MSEVCQLVQVVCHACKGTESVHGILRQRLPDVAVHSQFINDFGERAPCPSAAMHQFGIIRPVEIDFDGTVAFRPVGQSRPASLPAFRDAIFGMCPVHCITSFPQPYPVAVWHRRRFCGTQNLYLLPGHIPIPAHARQGLAVAAYMVAIMVVAILSILFHFLNEGLSNTILSTISFSLSAIRSPYSLRICCGTRLVVMNVNPRFS